MQIKEGFKFRMHSSYGVNQILEIKGDDAIVRLADGSIFKSPVNTLSKSIIPEPELFPREITNRVWVHSKKRMIYDIAGIVKTGQDWMLTGGPNRFYRVYTNYNQPHASFKAHESDLVIMPQIGYVSVDKEPLYEFDVVKSPNDATIGIIFWHNGHYHRRLIDGRQLGGMITPASELKRIGNIFEDEGSEYYDLLVKRNL